MIISDKRYGALKTLGERKACFHVWRDRKAKLEREEKKRKEREAKEAFKQMLEESGKINGRSRYKHAERMFKDDPRWSALDGYREKEDALNEVVAEKARQEREEEEARRKKAMTEFKELLKSVDWITPSSKWRNVDEKLRDEEKAQQLNKEDRLEVYTEYIRELESAEEERKQMEREQKRHQERKNREEFMRFLKEKLDAGEITTKTRWRSFAKQIQEQPEYEAINANESGSRPRELFEDVQDELENELEHYRGPVYEALGGEGSPSDYSSFSSRVRQTLDIPEAHLKSIWEEEFAPRQEAGVEEAEEGEEGDHKSRDKRKSKRKHRRNKRKSRSHSPEEGKRRKKERRTHHGEASHGREADHDPHDSEESGEIKEGEAE